MSGSNALAAAKRRRVGGIEPNKPTPRGAVAGQIQRGNIIQTNQRPVVGRPSLQQQPLPQYQNQARINNPSGRVIQPPQPVSAQNIKLSVNNKPINNKFADNKFTDRDEDLDSKSRDYSDIPESSRFFMIPPLTDKPISHLQLLAIVHRYFNKLAYHLPNAVDTLGTNFNLLSSNCDNLNERLEALESLTPESGNGTHENNSSVSQNEQQEIKEEFIKIRADINKMKQDFNSEINSIKENVSSLTDLLHSELTVIKQMLNDNINEHVELEEVENTEENVKNVDDSNYEDDVNNSELTDVTEIN